MKKILNYCLLAVPLLAAVSCTKGLEELNKNKVNPTSLDPALLLNNAIINTSYPTRTVLFDMGIVQQLVSPNGGVLAGANYNQDCRVATNASIWSVYSRTLVKYTVDA